MDNYDSLLISLLSNKPNHEAVILFDLLPVGIELYNKDGILVAANKYSLKLFGFNSPAQLRGLNLFYDNAVSPEIQERLANEEEFSLWHYFDYSRTKSSPKNGKIRVFTRFKKLRDSNKQLVGFVTICMEEQSNSTGDNSYLAPPISELYGTMTTQATHDANHNVQSIVIKECSPEACQMLGLKAEQMVGHDRLELPVHVPHLDAVGKLSYDNPRYTFFYYSVNTRKYIQWTVIYNNGETSFCKLSDITPDIMGNEAVNFSETLFRSVFDESPTAALFLDPKGRIEDVNQRYLKMMRINNKKEILGYRLSRDKRIDDEMRQKIEDSESYQYTQLLHPNTPLAPSDTCPVMYVRVTSQKFRLQSGVLRGYIIYVTDITKETLENHKLEDQKVKAQNDSDMKSRFLQNMSHDIRTPLNAIVGFSQLLSLPDGTLDPNEKEEYATHIANSSNMLMMLVDDILNISDVENGNYRIVPRALKLNELCANTLKSVEYRVPNNVKCYYKSDVDDSYVVITDGRRVQQVLINFLTNACKHTAQGEIQLVCKAHDIPGMIHFSVIDTGNGVDPALADELFQRFSKLTTVEGTGLGLNICRIIANKLHGEVTFDKSYTGGAKFDFIVPLVERR